MNATERLFQRLNQQYFAGRLPEYQIVLREDLNSGCGECDKKKREIHLDAKLAGDELTKVLLHEMAHAAVPRKAKEKHG